MGKSYFEFKKFTVHQDLCAMKVCTDACILGASVDVKRSKRILDIGTGTGLLALMAAQRSQAEIDAVEIEAGAAKQAQDNFNHSPWANRINLHHKSIQEYAFSSLLPYDVIVCNPPFFEEHLKAEDPKENTAWHSNDLERKALFNLIKKLLHSEGRAWILLSAHALGDTDKLATQEGLFEAERIRIHERSDKKDTRVIIVYASKPTEKSVREFTIRKDDGNYTSDFTQLLQEYYLNF